MEIYILEFTFLTDLKHAVSVDKYNRELHEIVHVPVVDKLPTLASRRENGEEFYTLHFIYVYMRAGTLAVISLYIVC